MTGSDACDHGRSLCVQMEFSGQGRIDHRDLRADMQ